MTVALLSRGLDSLILGAGRALISYKLSTVAAQTQYYERERREVEVTKS